MPSSGDEELREQAFEDVCDRFDRHLLPIWMRPEPWRLRIRAAAVAAARYCREHEDEVGFVIAERFRRGHLPLGERSLRLHIEEVDSVRWELPDPDAVSSATAEFAVGSFIELVIKRQAEGSLGALEADVPDLLYKVYEAYLGSEVAAEELAATCPLPKQKRPPRAPS